MNPDTICIHCMGINPHADSPCPHCGRDSTPDPALPHQLPPRTKLNGRYLLGRLLAADDTGFLYFAFDMVQEEKVIIRELYLPGICERDSSLGLCTDADQEYLFTQNRQRMLREAEVLSMLNRSGSECIVQLRAHFEANHTVYLVLAYTEAVTLRQYVSQNGKLSLERAISMMKPLCQTLSKIHSFATFHGGVHPDRVLISEDGNLLLSDFGAVGLPAADSYAPPEQKHGDAITGPWSDAYSFAQCMLFCLTGTDPVGTDLTRQQIQKQLKAAGCRSDRNLEAALISSLQIQPLKRAQSMDTWLNSMQFMPHRPNVVLWTVLSVVACAAMIMTFCLGGHNSNAGDPTMIETTPSETQVETQPGYVVENAVSEIVPGSYLLRNYADPNLIIGIDGGYCDNGAHLILTDYAALNHNRLLVTDHVPDDGFYNLQAAHTNSFLSAEDALGAPMTQYYSMQGLDSEKWIFQPFLEGGKTVFMLQNAAGYTIAPHEGALAAGTDIVLAEPDSSNPAQKWYFVWSERDTDEPTATVYQAGNFVLTLDGIYTPQFVSDSELVCTLTTDGEPELTFAAGANAVALRFEPHGDGFYRIYPISDADSGDNCLEYSPDSDRMVLRSVSDAKNQLFRVVYAGFGTYQLQTHDGQPLRLQSDTGAVCTTGTETSLDWRLTKNK